MTKPMNNARGTAVIDNSEHNDCASAKQVLVGSAGQIKEVIADSTVATPLQNNSVLRVANTTAATAFIWIGKEDEEPGAVNATNAFALPPNSVECIFAGASDDCQKALVMKASAAGVQVVLLKE